MISSEEVLKELYTEDYGIGSPNVANFYQLKQVCVGACLGKLHDQNEYYIKYNFVLFSC